MKRLYLLRHAEASSAYGSSDIERPLTDKGKSDAATLGEIMAAKSYEPALIYCSPATRTQQTLAGVSEALQGLNTETSRLLYGAAPGDMLSLIQNTKEDIGALLIIAHNPTIHHLSAMLADENSAHYNAITMRYAPGTLSVFDCDIDHWSDIQPGENALIDLVVPDA